MPQARIPDVEIPETEIKDLARLLVQVYGAGARGRCTSNSSQFLADGDLEGYEVWSRIERIVVALLRGEAGD